MNIKQTRFARLGKSLLDSSNPNAYRAFMSIDGTRNRRDRLREFAEEVEKADQYERKIQVMKQRLDAQRLQNQKMRSFIEVELQQSQRKIILSNQSIAADINKQFSTLQQKQSKLEESVMKISDIFASQQKGYWTPKPQNNIRDMQNKYNSPQEKTRYKNPQTPSNSLRYSENPPRRQVKTDLRNHQQEPKRLEYEQQRGVAPPIQRVNTTSKKLTQPAVESPTLKKQQSPQNQTGFSRPRSELKRLIESQRSEKLTNFLPQNPVSAPDINAENSQEQKVPEKISDILKQIHSKKSEGRQKSRQKTTNSELPMENNPEKVSRTPKSAARPEQGNSQKSNRSMLQRQNPAKKLQTLNILEQYAKLQQEIIQQPPKQKLKLFTPKSGKSEKLLQQWAQEAKVKKARRLKKYFLAVLYLVHLKREMRQKIINRKTKSEEYFKLNYQKIMKSIGASIHETFSDVKKKMVGFQNKKPAFLSTKECYKQILKLLSTIVGKLQQIKKLFTEDETILKLLTFLLSYNSFIPSGYLTKYELSKIQFSRSFGFMYKSQQLQAFLMSTFLLLRCIEQNFLCSGQSFDAIFTKNEVVQGMLRHLIDGFYQLAKEIIESYRNQIKVKGNWEELPVQMTYIPAEAVTTQILKHCKKWDNQLLDQMKADPVWGRLQTKIKEWIEDILEYVYEHSD